MPLKFYVFSIVFLVIILLAVGCTRRTDLQKAYIARVNLAERAGAIELLIKSDNITLTGSEHEVVGISTTTIRAFIDVWEDFVTKAEPGVKDVKNLALWHGKGSFAYKQIFHIYSNPLNWNKLTLENQLILMQFHRDVITAEQESVDIHKDYERTESYLKTLRDIVDVFKIIGDFL
ncbi:hypothetical protein KAR91_26940 [Candidatus Pacearchaeota archaeon]|nr:hypothetical protein [Candidatus Pacearchaeota archaeon]